MERTGPAVPRHNNEGVNGAILCIDKPLTPSTPGYNIAIPLINASGAPNYGEIPPQQEAGARQGQQFSFPFPQRESGQAGEGTEIGHSATATTKDKIPLHRLRDLNDIRNQIPRERLTFPAPDQTQTVPQQPAALPEFLIISRFLLKCINNINLNLAEVSKLVPTLQKYKEGFCGAG